ncbi:isoaspartyl peptidase/L-asparaginase [Patescibacteria group bacterium]|nr:isoaspartyl peptidase/L-asparaginase [Patescibacteria group bacterium]
MIQDRRAIIVHGGAGAFPVDDIEKHALEEGCMEAASMGWRILGRRGSAQTVAVKVIKLMEDNNAFNAGTGAYLNEHGVPEFDAGIVSVENGKLRIGGVGALPATTRNPILLAEALLDEPENLLAGLEAERFARTRNIPACRPEELIVPRTRQIHEESRRQSLNGSPMSDTVGCVVLDRRGNMCAAGSTGGFPGKRAGRVGDVPQFLHGFGGNSYGVACATGQGEAIMRVALCSRALTRLPRSHPTRAAVLAIEDLQRLTDEGEAGIIVLDHEGHIGCAHNTRYMSVASYSTLEGETTNACRNALPV